MLELAPGVYSAPRISPSVRERIWCVLSEWFPNEFDASIVLVWANPEMPGGQSVLTLGCPPIKIAEIDGLLTTQRTTAL
jgi:CRISPR-associated protein Cas2